MQADPDSALSPRFANAGRNLRVTAIVAGLAAAAITAAIVLDILPAGRKAPGFLGPGTLAADINLVLEILLVLGLTVGFHLARRGNIEAHRINQTTWVLVNAVLVATIMVSALQNVKIKSARDLLDIYYAVSWLHALIGMFTLAAGLWLVLQMNDIMPRRFHVRRWKRLMRITLAGYWSVALLGFATYYFWYMG